MTAGRHHRGCWTCRLRHKKCDEVRPNCRACEQRDLQCHGYGVRPTWFDGGEEERAELEKVKAAVKSSLRRRFVARQDRVSERSRDAETIGDGTSSLLAITPPPLTALRKASTASTGERISSYREAELLMHYIDNVFPLQFRFYTGKFSTHSSPRLIAEADLRNSSRNWLFWLLISTGPLYHAALSLSALHQYKLEKGVGNVATELPSYHARALTDLHTFVGYIQEVGNLDSITEQIQILACGVSLISFELFRGGNDDWRPHLDALASLPVIQDVSSLTSSTDLEEWQQAALTFFIPVTVWFDLLACASTRAAPRAPYQRLTATRFGDVQSVMGCDTWVMEIIGDLAHLYQWKISQQDTGRLSMPELVSRSRNAEQRLVQSIDELESASSRKITRVFAAGALVYLHSIVSGAYPALGEIQTAVEHTLRALEAIDDAQMVRGLVWPLCIAACLATSDLRLRFRSIAARAIDVSGDFGNSRSILDVVQTCWGAQDQDQYAAVDWRQAMDELGTNVLLV